MELGLAGTDVAPTAADNLDVEGSPYNRSASCDLVFAGTKYVDYILHKVLAKCDSVNKYYAYHGKPHSTATLIQLLNNWCTSQHGSTTTIIDADEQQCSNGSGAYNVATVGYVNKYGDLWHGGLCANNFFANRITRACVDGSKYGCTRCVMYEDSRINCSTA